MRILIVEDFEPLGEATQRGLTEQGFVVDLVLDGREGLTRALTGDYDAILLDLMLPGLDGLQVLATLRQRGVRTPVLILTARDELDDRVRGLDLGADDYVTKPFAMEELFARVRALVRRRYDRMPNHRVGHVEIDFNARTATVAGEAQELSAREFALLEYLVMREGDLVTRAEIQTHLYGDSAPVGSNVVDVYIGYLRKRIERDGHPKLIHTRRGSGYQFGLQD